MKKLLTLCCIAASLLVVGCNRTADKGGADGSELYGYVNIRLPHIEGMHECHTHPRVMAFTERYRQSGPILGTTSTTPPTPASIAWDRSRSTTIS